MGRKRVGAVVVALTLVVAGCGGSNPQHAKQAAASGRPVGFVGQVNAICKESRTDITRFANAHQQAARGSAGAMSAFVLAIVDRQDAAIKRLDAVEPPAGVTSDYHAYLATRLLLDKLQRQVVRLAPPSAEGQVKPGTKAAAINERRTDKAHLAVRQAHALGLEDCGA